MILHGQLPDLATRRNRRYYFEGDRRGGVLLVVGAEPAVYLLEWVQVDPEQPEPATVLVAHQTDAAAEIYCTREDGSGCDCWGWKRWRRCLHSASVTLISRELEKTAKSI